MPKALRDAATFLVGVGLLGYEVVSARMASTAPNLPIVVAALAMMGVGPTLGVERLLGKGEPEPDPGPAAAMSDTPGRPTPRKGHRR